MTDDVSGLGSTADDRENAARAEVLVEYAAVPRGAGPAWPRWLRLGSLLLIIACLLALSRLLPVGQMIALLSGWVDDLGFWGPLVFGLAYIVGAVLFVPGLALTLAAGAVFGLGWGTVIVSLASTIAAAVAFLVARYLARDAVRDWARRFPKFGAIDRAIGEGGWKVIALLRLSPAVPYSLGNYLFGLTAIRFWPYVIASWVAMLPGTFMWVYLGFAGREGVAAVAGAGERRSAGEWAMLAVGLAATLVVTVYVTRLAARAIRRQTPLDASSDTVSGSHEQTTTPSASRGTRGTFALAGFAVLMVIGTACAYLNPGVVQGLFGPPQVAMAEAYERKPGGPTFDHADFDTLLGKHVDDAGFVDYASLLKDVKSLDAYNERIGKAPFDEMGRDEKLALLINAYNAFTLKLILEYRDDGELRSIRDIPAAKRWDDERWNVGGHVWSLNHIEHEEIRPKFKEPRIHWALVCAAVGCPPLRRDAYTAEDLEQQLEEQAVYVHTHDRWFRYDREAGIVHLTKLYQWYAGDYEQAAGSVLDYVARYAKPLREDLDAGRRPRVRFLDYDWALNSRENRP